jgi:hypothetical protein
MKLYLPVEKFTQNKKQNKKKTKQKMSRGFDSRSIRKLSEVIGNLKASLQTVHQAQLHYDYRHLQMTKNLVLKGQNYDAKVVLSQEAKQDLDWWSNYLKEFNGRKPFCQSTKLRGY